MLNAGLMFEILFWEVEEAYYSLNLWPGHQRH